MENKLSNLTPICNIGEVQTSLSLIHSMHLMHNPSSIDIKNGGFLLTVFENDDISTLSGSLNPFMRNIFHYMNNQNVKENIYLTAIDNLLKKNDFLQLSIQLDQELISNDEFNNELEHNEEKYLIRMDHDFNHDYFKYISEILPRLNRQFSSDDVSEMFSVPIEEVNLYLDSFLDESK